MTLAPEVQAKIAPKTALRIVLCAPRGFCVCTPRTGPLAQLFALDALDAVRDAYPSYDVVLLDDGAWVVAAVLRIDTDDAPCRACKI